MAKKSKGFGELLHQQRQTQNRQNTQKKLAKRVQENYQGKVKSLQWNEGNDGTEKMSDVLEAFIEPYLADIADREEMLKLLAIASLSWNLALLPDKEQATELKKFIKGLTKDKRDPQLEREMRKIIEGFVRRKKEVFPDNQRKILDFELKGNKDNFYLSVVSTLPESEQASGVPSE